MELIVISRTKLKVMLSAEDMKRLDFDPCGGGELHGRSAFRSILKEARDRCGFDAVGERVFVQYYPEKHGGCEMFVTKIARSDGKTEEKPIAVRDAGYIVYRFTSLEALISLCSRLKHGGRQSEGVMFVVEERLRKYYLALERETPLAGEYGGVKLGRGAMSYLCEHGRRVFTNAVARLADFHCGI